MARVSTALLLVVAASAAILPGCAAPPEPKSDWPIAAGEYVATFEAARQVLRDTGFGIDRTDPAAGVLATRTKATAGLGTPWDREQATAGDEIEDLFNRDARQIRITFEPDPPTPETVDLRDTQSTLLVRVRAVKFRRHRPNWQLESSAIQLSQRAEDPALDARGMSGEYRVAYTEDRVLAARLADEIRRLAAQTPSNTASTAPAAPAADAPKPAAEQPAAAGPR
jgi:hypothetical protein